MHLSRIFQGSLLACVAALSACDNGTTAAPIPVYEASTADVGVFQVADTGVDAPDAARDAKSDATVDAAHPSDAGHDGTVDAASDTGVDAGSDVHVASEAGKDAAPDAAVDAPHTTDAADAHE